MGAAVGGGMAAAVFADSSGDTDCTCESQL